MYLAHYNLKAQPFQINADPKFLWLGEKHKEAFATLKYGVLHNEGFLLLTGDVGTGKTTLINALIDSAGDGIIVAKIPDPGLSTLDFFKVVANAYNMDREFDNKSSFLIQFSKFLEKSHANNNNVVLIIDEAQRLNYELCEEIRHLANIENRNRSLLTIFFVGQNEINDILLADENRALRQRITIRYNLDPLTENEVKEYVRHRLKLAGSELTIFTSDAIREIFRFSGGIPRLINIVCDFSLLSGYVSETTEIASEIVEECARQLRLPNEKQKDEMEIVLEDLDQHREQPPIGYEDSKQDSREQETVEDTRTDIVAETGKKPARRVAVYIGLLLFLLGVGGYFYSQAEHREGIKNVIEYTQQVMSSWKPSEEIDHADPVKPDRDASAAVELQAQAAEGEILRALAEEARGEVPFKEDVSKEGKHSFDEEQGSSSGGKEADLTDSVATAQTSQIEDSGKAESPDSTEIIDWLLEKRSEANKQ